MQIPLEPATSFRSLRDEDTSLTDLSEAITDTFSDGEDEGDALYVWLQTLGFEELYQSFKNVNIKQVSDLSKVNERMLQDMGVSDGFRQELLVSISDYLTPRKLPKLSSVSGGLKARGTRKKKAKTKPVAGKGKRRKRANGENSGMPIIGNTRTPPRTRIEKKKEPSEEDNFVP